MRKLLWTLLMVVPSYPAMAFISGNELLRRCEELVEVKRLLVSATLAAPILFWSLQAHARVRWGRLGI